MKKDNSALFCNISGCLNGSEDNCSSGFLAFINPNSCVSHILVTSFDILLLFIFLSTFLYRVVSKKTSSSTSADQKVTPLSVFSAVFNGLLALAYLAYGISTLTEKQNTEGTILPLYKSLVLLIQGSTWLILSSTVSLRKLHLSHTATAKTFSIFMFLLGAFLCFSSLYGVVLDKAASAEMVLNVLCGPGAILLVLGAFLGSNYARACQEIGDLDASYGLLQGDEADKEGEISPNENVTPFASSGWLSLISFWWLNPLMKKGKQKVLEDEDIPKLRQEDRAQTLYSMFTEQFNKKKHRGSSDPPSILSTIVSCQRKVILVSGFFALIKVLTLACTPLFLSTFIRIVEGNSAFKYEGYAVTAGLLFVKLSESLSERQWYFRARLMGLQIRSLLSAAIYQKQLQLSNAAKMTHSPGEIVNYVTVDAYRVGEFPFWFHQIWATTLQLFLALVIIYFSVGLATVLALTVLILTIVGSTPLAKLQHEYQTKFMVAQNKRLKDLSEALTNMKILKLYSWETHFKNVVERLRNEELKWISKVLMQKGYYVALFWSSPLLVGVFTFWTCYFLGSQLYASNVVTFLATLAIAQEQID